MYKIEKKTEYVFAVSPPPASGDELTEEICVCMIEQAVAALKNSFAPYSHYNVAAAALFSSGKIYTGANIESAAFTPTVCAERNAIHHAAAMGERRLIAVAVVGGPDCHDAGDLANHDYCTPCGVCRQVMRDFGDPETMRIICARAADDYKVLTLDELLPASFGAGKISM